MRSFMISVLVAATLCLPLGSIEAGVDPAAPPVSGSQLEILVMEAPGCIYCNLFRRDVLPGFQASERGRELPVRFVDINDLSPGGIELDRDIDIVPTFVVIRNNREVGRISGYTGPEAFFHSINYIVSSAP